MAKPKIPLYDLKLSRAAIREAHAVLSSGWLATGPRAEALEKAISRITGVGHTVAVSSGTAGLELALTALRPERGGEVITSPFTFVATVEAIYRSGLKAVFADIDPNTLCINPADVAKKISTRTVCILPVDIGGLQADYAALKKICKGQTIPIVADAAHSLGATQKGKSSAQLASAAVYSFQATKNVAGGEGGAVVARSKRLADRIRLLSRHAMTSIAYQRRRSGLRSYDVTDLGLKANLSDLHAAVALGQLTVFEKNQAKRARLAARYLKRLAPLGEYMDLPSTEGACQQAWHLFIVRLKLSKLRLDRDDFISLMAKAGVECGVHFKPVFELSYYRKKGFSARGLPHAAIAGQRVVSLPMYPELRLSDVDNICKRIGQIILRHTY